MLEAVLWLVALEVLGLAVLPLALRVLFALPDRGYASAKILGLLLVAYLAWSTSILGLTAFTGATIVVFAAAIGVVSWWRWGSELRAAWAEARGLALGAELTFLVAYAGAVAIRAHNAPIAGQEKQMDYTFMHSLIRAQSLPAEDFWLAGFGMPYYYLGYLIQSLIAKVLPIDPAVAYNLAMASVLALAACGAFGLVAALSRLAGGSARVAVGAGAFGAFALVVMGNLQALCELLSARGIGDVEFWNAFGVKNIGSGLQGFPPDDGGWWFRAARVIPLPYVEPDGITEFPYFSFILGDLHPHYMAIPLVILVATLAAHEVMIGAPLESDRVRLGVAAVALGAVIPSNTWDVPVLWGIFLLALLATVVRRHAFSVQALLARLGDFGVVVALAVVLYLPYFVGYVSQPLGIGLVTQRTPIGSLLVLFGPLIVLAFAGGVVGMLRAGFASSDLPEGRVLIGIGVGGIALGVVLYVLREPTLGLLVATLAMWAVLAWYRARLGIAPASVASALLVLIGVGSILVPEVVYLRDLFGTRMNTVFKFYYDAWIFLALAAPLICVELLATIRTTIAEHAIENEVAREPGAAARAVAAGSLAIAGLLVLAGVLYPVAATQTKSAPFAGRPTLDGMVHLRTGRPDDAAAIDWLRATRSNAPVLEAVGNDYTDAARFSTFAGVPTLVGWGGHEVQWRGGNPEIERRRQLAQRAYTEQDEAFWRKALEDLGVRYVVVGSMERELYGPDAGAALAQKLTRVHQSGNTSIYALQAPPSPLVAASAP
jgi:YYY domain-containing protein